MSGRAFVAERIGRSWSAARTRFVQSPAKRSESVVPSASAIRLAVGIVGECQPRSISPRYFPSILGMRRATSSSVSSNSSRRARIASPSLRVSGSARVRRGNDIGVIAVHRPASLCFFCGVEHPTCSPLTPELFARRGWPVVSPRSRYERFTSDRCPWRKPRCSKASRVQDGALR